MKRWSSRKSSAHYFNHPSTFTNFLLFSFFLSWSNSALFLFLAVLVFGIMCFDRSWLLYPAFNHLDWSYYTGVTSLFFSIIGTFILFIESTDARERKKKMHNLVYSMQSRYGNKRLNNPLIILDSWPQNLSLSLISLIFLSFSLIYLSLISLLAPKLRWQVNLIQDVDFWYCSRTFLINFDVSGGILRWFHGISNMI